MNFDMILQLLTIIEKAAAIGNAHPAIVSAAAAELDKINTDLAAKAAKATADKAKAEADATAAAAAKAPTAIPSTGATGPTGATHPNHADAARRI